MLPIQPSSSTCLFLRGITRLDGLLEGTVDGGADAGALPELDGGDGTLGDALGGELELLQSMLVIIITHVLALTT